VPFRAEAHTASFANAATDEVIRTLGGLSTWLAVARVPTAVIRAPIDLLRLRQTYDARYVLHGSVEQSHRQLRLTVELNEAETGRVLWSDRFDREIDEAGTVREQAGRDEAGLRIATAVAPLLTQRDLHRSGLSRPETLAAHDLALRAYGATLQPRPATFAAASGWLREALDRAPPHASTYFAMVAWDLMALEQGWAADVQRDDWVAATVIDKLDRDDPASMALLGYLHSSQHRDHALACTMLDRVIDTAPYCTIAWSLKSLVLSQLGEGEAAIVAAERAETMPALGPDRAWRSQVTALAYYVGGRYADAAGWARVSTMHHPGLAINARVLAASLAVLGRLDEAQQAANLALEIDPGFRIGAWRRRAHFTAECRERYAQRLRLAGLPE
jgi:TolB-like protein